MSSQVTAAKTDLVKSKTAAEKLRGQLELGLEERRKRNGELKKFQGLVSDLEQWLLSVQGQLGAEVKMANIKAVRDNLKVNEVLNTEKSPPHTHTF